jgi:hypothetical protein
MAKMIRNFQFLTILAVSAILPKLSYGTEYKPLTTALKEALGNPKQIFKKPGKADGQTYDLYYSKDEKGNPKKFASVQKALYETSCTHTWVIGLDASPAIKVDKIYVVEMSCADNTKSARSNSFLSQFEGKKVSDVKELDKQISAGSAAQSTYTGEYTITAVKRTLILASEFKL